MSQHLDNTDLIHMNTPLFLYNIDIILFHENAFLLSTAFKCFWHFPDADAGIREGIAMASLSQICPCMVEALLESLYFLPGKKKKIIKIDFKNAQFASFKWHHFRWFFFFCFFFLISKKEIVCGTFSKRSFYKRPWYYLQ